MNQGHRASKWPTLVFNLSLLAMLSFPCYAVPRLTSKENTVDKKHHGARIYILDQVIDFPLGLLTDIVIDLLLSIFSVLEVGGDTVCIVQVLGIRHKPLLWPQLLVQEQGVLKAQLEALGLLVQPLDKVMETPMKVFLRHFLEVEALLDLGQCGVLGAQTQHGEGGGDAHGGEEDVLAGAVGGQLLVQIEAEAQVPPGELLGGPPALLLLGPAHGAMMLWGMAGLQKTFYSEEAGQQQAQAQREVHFPRGLSCGGVDLRLVGKRTEEPTAPSHPRGRQWEKQCRVRCAQRFVSVLASMVAFNPETSKDCPPS